MAYTLEYLDQVIRQHSIPDWVTALTPGMRERQQALSHLIRYRDQVLDWAMGEVEVEREKHVARAVTVERELAGVLAGLVLDYRVLGMEVGTRPTDLEAAWPEASDRLHRHARDEALLKTATMTGVATVELEAGGMIVHPAHPDPLLAAGARIREELDRMRRLVGQAEFHHSKADAVDVHDVDARHVGLLNELQATGLVPGPSSDARPVLADRLVAELASVGIDLAGTFEG